MKIALRNTAILAVLAALALAGAYAIGLKREAPVVSVVGMAGQAISIASLRGQVVLVNFWATTCSTCASEMPQIAATFEKYRSQGYATLAVAMSYDNPDWIRAYTARNALPFTVAQDRDGAAARAFGDVHLTPTSFLIDRKGRIVRQFQGEPQWPALHAQIEKLLAEPA